MADFCGFGTQWYGRYDRRADGSYVTTRWITALYVPVFPLESWRVRQVGTANYSGQLAPRQAGQRVPHHWRALMDVYCVVWPLAALVLGWLILGR